MTRGEVFFDLFLGFLQFGRCLSVEATGGELDDWAQGRWRDGRDQEGVARLGEIWGKAAGNCLSMASRRLVDSGEEEEVARRG